MKMKRVFLNGKIVPLEKAKISVLDRGFLYGDGAFETMRAYDGDVFRLEEHIDRLMIALKILKIKAPYGKKELCSFVGKTVTRNGLKNAYIKIIITRGVTGYGIEIPLAQKPTAVIYANKLTDRPNRIYEKGLKAHFACISKNENSFIARIKSLNYIDNILARYEARTQGYDEALFVNTKNFVTEAATSNVFAVKNGKVFTPPPTAGLLPGITRQMVIRLLGKYLENNLYETNITMKDLAFADEVFLTNSVLEIVPVVKLGRQRIGKGIPGPFYKFIHALYRMEVKNV